MTNNVDRFHTALTVLAGHGHIKQRLIKAYEDNLADINEDELPLVLTQSFADLRHQMHSVAPLNGEGAVRASVRKMSFQEASDCASLVVTMYGDISRLRDNEQGSLGLPEVDEARVPPFLVKTV